MENQVKEMKDEDLIISGLSVIEWCEKHGLYQQAYTMAAELIITAICLKNSLNEKNFDARELASNLLTDAIKIHHKKKGIDEITNSKDVEIVQDLLDYQALLDRVHDIRNYRNDINHAGWRLSPLLSEKFIKAFRDWYGELKKGLLSYYGKK